MPSTTPAPEVAASCTRTPTRLPRPGRARRRTSPRRSWLIASSNRTRSFWLKLAGVAFLVISSFVVLASVTSRQDEFEPPVGGALLAASLVLVLFVGGIAYLVWRHPLFGGAFLTVSGLVGGLVWGCLWVAWGTFGTTGKLLLALFAIAGVPIVSGLLCLLAGLDERRSLRSSGHPEA